VAIIRTNFSPFWGYVELFDSSFFSDGPVFLVFFLWVVCGFCFRLLNSRHSHVRLSDEDVGAVDLVTKVGTFCQVGMRSQF